MKSPCSSGDPPVNDPVYTCAATTTAPVSASVNTLSINDSTCSRDSFTSSFDTDERDFASRPLKRYYGHRKMECDFVGAKIDSNVSTEVSSELDKAVNSTDCFNIRIKDEPIDSANELLLDDELRLQIERSIEMVVNEFSATTTTTSSSTTTGIHKLDDQVTGLCTDSETVEMTTSVMEIDSVCNSTVTQSKDTSMMPDSTPAVAEAVASPSSASLRNTISNKWSCSSTLRKCDINRQSSNSIATMEHSVVSIPLTTTVKSEPRDLMFANPDQSASAISGKTVVVAPNAPSSDCKKDSEAVHPSRSIDLLTMLSIEKKPAALSILPVTSHQSNITNDTEFSLTPNVTIKSMPMSSSSLSLSKCSTWNGEMNPVSTSNQLTGSSNWSIPCYVNTSSSYSSKTCENSSFSFSPDSSVSTCNESIKNGSPSNHCPSYCSSSINRPNLTSRNCVFGKYNSTTPRVTLPSSCSSYLNAYSSRKSTASLYPQQSPQHHQPSTYGGLRSCGPISSVSYNMPTASPMSVNPASFAMNGPTTGLFCSSVASPLPPTGVYYSKTNSCPSLPPPPPPPPPSLPLTNSCRMSLSPTGSHLRTKDLTYPTSLVCNMMPDSSGNLTATGATATAIDDSASAYIQQQQQPPPPPSSLRSAANSWNASAAISPGTGSAFRNPIASQTFNVSSPKATRISSLSTLVRHSNSPHVYSPYTNPAMSSNSLMLPNGHHNSPVKAVNATSGTMAAYPGSLNGGCGGVGGAFPVPSPFGPTGMPFHRSQCCFSSQIQCFNAACDNASQQHVSIVQHSTRLSNLKSSSMDSISSLLQYHTYFKKY